MDGSSHRGIQNITKPNGEDATLFSSYQQPPNKLQAEPFQRKLDQQDGKLDVEKNVSRVTVLGAKITPKNSPAKPR